MKREKTCRFATLEVFFSSSSSVVGKFFKGFRSFEPRDAAISIQIRGILRCNPGVRLSNGSAKLTNKACAIGCLIRDAFLCFCVYTNLKHLEFREKVFALLLTSRKDFIFSDVSREF